MPGGCTGPSRPRLGRRVRFYGWIGDTRVVSRALRPDQFLTAV